MNKNIMRLVSRFFCAALALVIIASCLPTSGFAADDPFIVVSMGDSYSSGEGVPPFYGYSDDRDPYELIKDEDWLAHRSKKSWPGQLIFQEASSTMSAYRVGESNNSDIKWYFVASSGAKTTHYKNKQKKEYDREMTGLTPDLEGETYLDPQLDIYTDANLTGDVDYVTMTIGGNDVGFASIVESAFIHNAHVHWGSTSNLEDKFTNVWNEVDSLIGKLVKAYKNVQSAAGSQAEIIVAGYPQLFDPDVAKNGVNKYEARLINSNVTEFNDLIQDIVTTLGGNSSGSTKTEYHSKIESIISENDLVAGSMKIHFVDVEEKFLGHGARSDNEWINGIILFAYDEDLDHDAISSAYSVHPNEKGAKAYAECVNAKIAEIENAGILSGKICKASDRTTPVTDATIHIIQDGSTRTLTPDSNGNYSVELPVGTYLVKVTADGYIEFNAFATIESRQEVFMETFLMVEGEETDIGEAIGTITNALTGNGIEGVTLDVRSGWNNTDSGDILTTVTTNASGNYTVTLPIGNYTLCASKAGYISTTINVVVQPDVCTTKNASMTPIISGDNFRIVLTWGSSPSDLDSHVVGTLSNGNSFHVYYGDKSEYDGDIEVCNLDVDDTTSYGPETITLNTITNEPYYYYIYNYSSSTGMITSEAQIKVYQGENLVATFNVPTNQADARYWNVFAIVNGELIVSNTITSSADLSYANTFSEVNALAIDAEVDVEADMLASPKENTEAEPQSETEPVAKTDLQIETEPVVETAPTA